MRLKGRYLRNALLAGWPIPLLLLGPFGKSLRPEPAGPAWFPAPAGWQMVEYQSKLDSKSGLFPNQIYEDEVSWSSPLPPAKSLVVVKRVLGSEIRGDFLVSYSNQDYLESEYSFHPVLLDHTNNPEPAAYYASECGPVDSHGFGRPDAGETVTAISVKIIETEFGSQVVLLECDSNAAAGPLLCS